MKIINDISSIEKYTTPTAMTIGMFDGIHPGHQKIFKFLQKKTLLINLLLSLLKTILPGF